PVKTSDDVAVVAEPETRLSDAEVGRDGYWPWFNAVGYPYPEEVVFHFNDFTLDPTAKCYLERLIEVVAVENGHIAGVDVFAVHPRDNRSADVDRKIVLQGGSI